MSRLKNLRIYDLPNGKRSLVALHDENSGYSLYDLEYGTRLPPRYSIEADGRLVNWFGDFPIFTVDDLIDTGKDYQQ
jgi:hypothetical protein